ncbi:MAG: hypothetical protein ACFFD4_28550 [Candidatus Odinarchaeota archaeon]
MSPLRKRTVLYLLVLMTASVIPVTKTNSSSTATYVGKGDLVLMDYSIYYQQVFYNRTADVYVYIGSAASVPIALDDEYYIITHPTVFWEKLIGSPVPSDLFVITLNTVETTAYNPLDFVYGKEINFHVTLKELAYDDSTIKNPLSSIPFLGEAFILILLVITSFVGYKLYKKYKHLFIKQKMCTVCGRLGQGKCIKCERVYCRKCFFDKGCLDCHSNQFKPYSSKIEKQA